MKKILPVILLLAFLLPNQSFAQASNITVSPQLVRLDLSTDPSEAEYFYTNNTSQTVELNLTMQDVKELEDRGTPDLLDQNEAQNYKYGLTNWVTFSNNNLVLSPGETKKVTVFIDDKRLSVGGHYASVLAEIKQIADTKTVNLRAILASLLFVRTGTGGEIEEAEIINARFNQNFYSYPHSMSFSFSNTGNVDLTPYGTVKIYDPFGRELSRSIVNEDSLITLPESQRKYTVPVTQKATILPPGMYKAVVSVDYGKSQQKKVITVEFFSLGTLTMDKLLIIIIVGGIATFALLLPFRKSRTSISE